jgi:hypothetical protein
MRQAQKAIIGVRFGVPCDILKVCDMVRDFGTLVTWHTLLESE